MPEIYKPVSSAVRRVSDTLESLSGPLNVIFQTVESYAYKAAAIKEKTLSHWERNHLVSLTEGLRRHLESDDVSSVLVYLIRTEAEKKMHYSGVALKIVEAVSGSVRILLTSDSALAALKTLLSSVPGGDNKKEGAN